MVNYFCRIDDISVIDVPGSSHLVYPEACSVDQNLGPKYQRSTRQHVFCRDDNGMIHFIFFLARI